MVLDDECLVERDLDNFVLGEVKDFSSINNLLILLSNEGFQHVRLVYLGGLWVMIELPSIETKTRFMKHVGVASGLKVLELEDNKDDCFAQLKVSVWSPSFKGVNDAEFVSDDDSVNGEEEKNDDMSKKVNLEDESDIEGVSETVFGDQDDPLVQELNQNSYPTEKKISQVKLLMISIYAPQSSASKRILWNYISNLIGCWDGHYMVIGDFNKVRCVEDRFSSEFNAQRNKMVRFKKKLQILKKKIRLWVNDYRKKQSGHLEELRSNLRDIDKELDQGGTNEAKIQWAIEGDENSKFFHGIINRKRANLAIKGVMVDGDWVDDPCRVKEEFRLHN
ncbi:RNA-directed DNA polymerase, eukaryota [Tanacetum coccineum]